MTTDYSDRDLLDYQAHGTITLQLSQINCIFPAERSYGVSRGSMSPYVGFYAKQVLARFVQKLDDQGDDVSRSLDIQVGIAALVIGKVKDSDGTISSRDEKDLVVFPTSQFSFKTRHRVSRSLGRQYSRSSKRNRQEKLIVYYTLQSAFTETSSDTKDFSGVSASIAQTGLSEKIGTFNDFFDQRSDGTATKSSTQKPGAITVSNEFDDYHILTQVQQSYENWYSKANIETRRSDSGASTFMLGRKESYERRKNVKRILHLDTEGRRFHSVVNAFQFAPKLKIHGLDEYEIKLSTYLSKFTSVERNRDTGEIESISKVLDTYFIGIFKRLIVAAVSASHAADMVEPFLTNAEAESIKLHQTKGSNEDRFEGDQAPRSSSRRGRRRRRSSKYE